MTQVQMSNTALSPITRTKNLERRGVDEDDSGSDSRNTYIGDNFDQICAISLYNLGITEFSKWVADTQFFPPLNLAE